VVKKRLRLRPLSPPSLPCKFDLQPTLIPASRAPSYSLFFASLSPHTFSPFFFSIPLSTLSLSPTPPFSFSSRTLIPLPISCPTPASLFPPPGFLLYRCIRCSFSTSSPSISPPFPSLPSQYIQVLRYFPSLPTLILLSNTLLVRFRHTLPYLFLCFSPFALQYLHL